MENQLQENNLPQEDLEKSKDVFTASKKPKIPGWINWFILAAVVLIAAEAVWRGWTDFNKATENKRCIQVITPARNQITGECKVFPTPCDVPLSGWTEDEGCGNNDKIIKEETADTSDWQTYRNEEYGFEMKYPENFFFISQQLRTNNISFSEKGVNYNGVYLGETTNGCSLLVYQSKENPFITNYYQGDTYISTLVADYKKISNANIVFFIGLSAVSRAVEPSNCTDLFNQILSTFKFTSLEN